MSHSAKFRILIALPSDVTEERKSQLRQYKNGTILTQQNAS